MNQIQAAVNAYSQVDLAAEVISIWGPVIEQNISPSSKYTCYLVSGLNSGLWLPDSMPSRWGGLGE